MTNKIIITGTESTGKTELIQQLAAHYHVPFLPDYSRIYIEQLNRPYREEDVLEIARCIIEEEEKLQYSGGEFFISDNDLINIKIWLQYYDWNVPRWLEEAIGQHKAQIYLLCDIDLPWVADEQRANPHDRKELLQRFVSELSNISANFHLIKGTNQQRLHSAVEVVDGFLRSQE